MRISRIKTAIGALVAIVVEASLAGCSSDWKKPGIYAESAFVSDYAVPHGTGVRGSARQDFVKASFDNGLAAYVWQNRSKEESDVNERDYGITYSIPITKKLSARVGGEVWTHPSGSFGEQNNLVARAGVNYSGAVDLDLDVTHITPDKEVERGTRYVLRASKTFPFYESPDKTLSASVTPGVNTSIIDNYYGRSCMFPQFTAGVGLDMKKKFKKFDLGAGVSVNQQIGNASGIDSFTWSGLKASIKF